MMECWERKNMCSEEKIITSIEIQKNNKERVNIYIDGGYAFSCSAELVYTHEIKPKSSVNIEELQELINEDNYLKCKTAALKLIEKSYKTEKEIFDKLVKKGYEEKTAARVIAFLKSYNFLNDEEFARMYINDKIKSQGKNKIKYALLRKGIDDAIIEEKLKASGTEVEVKTAQKLAEKRYKLLLNQEKDRRKISGKLWEYLIRNGFNKDIIEDIIQKLDIPETIEQETEENISDFEELRELAEKRYSVLIKSEQDRRKLYKKLADYLMRRGFKWEDIKKTISSVINDAEVEE
jgi:regulatory protein